MKNTNRSHRGESLLATTITVGILALGACLFAPPAQADNSASYYVNTTNPVVVGTTTNQANVVAAASTNVFNLSTAAGNWANTNLWPACPLIVDHNQYLPSRWITHQEQGQCVAANTGVLIERYAGSTDGSHWQTNPCPLVIILTGNGTVPAQAFTNYDCAGFQYFNLFTEENTNATVAWTNLWKGDGFSRGL